VFRGDSLTKFTIEIMERTKQDYLDLLQETVDFYNLNNRGFNEEKETCEYITHDGKMCAVGRCMIDPKVGYAENLTVNNLVFKDNNITSVDDLLKPEYRGYPVSFWVELQGLHDTQAMWTDEGLSARGEQQVKNIIEAIESNFKEEVAY